MASEHVGGEVDQVTEQVRPLLKVTADKNSARRTDGRSLIEGEGQFFSQVPGACAGGGFNCDDTTGFAEQPDAEISADR